MKKIIPNGTEVLIFKYVKEWGIKQDTENFIKGIVESSELSENLSMHGSPWNEQIYTVIGEDGNKYTGTYGIGVLGNSFFRTMDDHIDYLEYQIKKNYQEIEQIKNKNVQILEEIFTLKESKNKKVKTLHK